MKLVRQVINDWKVGKNCELALNCVNGGMKVTLTADLGRWVKPQPHPQPQHSETGDRGHQGPRRRAGPSYLRRQEKRAAARAAAPALGPEAEQATAVPSAVEADTAPVTSATEAATAPAADQAAAATKGKQVIRTCSSCKQPCLGHAGPTGARCSNAQKTPALPSPEKLLGPPSSLLQSPCLDSTAREDRLEPLLTLQDLPPPSVPNVSFLPSYIPPVLPCSHTPSPVLPCPPPLLQMIAWPPSLPQLHLPFPHSGPSPTQQTQ